MSSVVDLSKHRKVLIMSKKKENKYLSVSYREYTRVIREGGGKPYSDSGTTETDFYVTGVFKEKTGGVYSNLVEVKDDYEEGDEAFVVVVRYDTGDTFGSSENCGCIVDVCKTEKEASAIAVLCEDKTHPDSYMWNGYFDRFRGVEIARCVVGRGSA